MNYTKEDVTRYSVLEKLGFKVMKVNFFNEIENGFELIRELSGKQDYWG